METIWKKVRGLNASDENVWVAPTSYIFEVNMVFLLWALGALVLWLLVFGDYDIHQLHWSDYLFGGCSVLFCFVSVVLLPWSLFYGNRQYRVEFDWHKKVITVFRKNLLDKPHPFYYHTGDLKYLGFASSSITVTFSDGSRIYIHNIQPDRVDAKSIAIKIALTFDFPINQVKWDASLESA